MNRMRWGACGLLGCLLGVTAIADEPAAPGVARVSPMRLTSEADTARPPFVNLDVRLIELHGKRLLPAESKKASLTPVTSRHGVNENRLLTAEQWAQVHETWKSEPDAKILTAARLRMKLGARGEYRKGREIPVSEQPRSDKTNRNPSPIIRTEFCGTSIDATFQAFNAKSILIDIALSHTIQEGYGQVGGSSIKTRLNLEEGQTFILPLQKRERTAAVSHLPFVGNVAGIRGNPFAREELTEQGLIVLITPVLEDGSDE